ncbi:MAG: shikimate kinase [Alphaproteobacteria bacterium]
MRALATELKVDRTIVLVGMPGAGKTAIGRRLATALGLPFKDADAEIELAAGRTIPEIFAERGEGDFRRGERLVIARLIRKNPPLVLATGGGAYMNAETRALLKETAVTIWLRAEFDTLLRRVERKTHRPLLQADVRGRLAKLMEERHPVYADADITIDSGSGPHTAAVESVLSALKPYFGADRTVS